MRCPGFSSRASTGLPLLMNLVRVSKATSIFRLSPKGCRVSLSVTRSSRVTEPPISVTFLSGSRGKSSNGSKSLGARGASSIVAGPDLNEGVCAKTAQVSTVNTPIAALLIFRRQLDATEFPELSEQQQNNGQIKQTRVAERHQRGCQLTHS